MPTRDAAPSLRQEHRDATRRRLLTASRAVFVKRGYLKATVEEIIAAAGVSRATLYLHFDSKLDLMRAAAEKLAGEARAAAARLAVVLVEGDREELRAWIEWALRWYVRNRPVALAAQEAELTEDRSSVLLRDYLEAMEPWVATWPEERRAEARLRFELCRLQMHHRMWGLTPPPADLAAISVDVFTEMWWNTLVVPLSAG